jgi:GNAT superfamily N-acetyltransferase
MRAASFTIRRAVTADAPALARHRVGMFRDMGQLTDAQLPPLEAASARYLADALRDASYFGWVAELDGAIVAGAGLILRPLPPNPEHLGGGVEAYVLNVYTDPPQRRLGLARRLMDTVLDWCQTERIQRVRLHASDEGRPLYASMGFTATTEMGRNLPDQHAA